MSEQRTLASVPYDGKGRTTRRERFLVEMDAVIPWVRLQALILPHYAVAERGRRPLPLEIMLRVSFLQQWFDMSDPQAEDMLYNCAGYYAAQDRVPSTRATADVTLAARITDTFTACHGRYGAPRVQQALRVAGDRAGRKRVARLTRAASLQARRPRRVAVTTDSATTLPLADNVVARQYTVGGPVNTVWVRNTTLIPTGEGWVHLAVVTELACALSSAGPRAPGTLPRWCSRPCSARRRSDGLDAALCIMRTAAVLTPFMTIGPPSRDRVRPPA